MDITRLPSELVIHITDYLPLEDCLSWKLSSSYFNNLLSGFDDLFQAQYLRQASRGFNTIDNGSSRWTKLYEIFCQLDKGRWYLALNDNSWLVEYIFKCCAEYGDADLINIMLDNNRVDPSIYKNYAICMSSYKGYLSIVERLLEDPRVNFGKKSLRSAIRNGHLPVVNRLLEDPRVGPFMSDNFPILIAICNGHIDIVRRLLEDPRVLPNYFSMDFHIRAFNYQVNLRNDYLGSKTINPITLAAKLGHIDIIKILLEDPRVDPAIAYNMPCKVASDYGHVAIVDILLKDPRVDPSDNGNIAIIIAASKGHIEVVERLLEDPRVDPSDCNNQAIRSVYNHIMMEDDSSSGDLYEQLRLFDPSSTISIPEPEEDSYEEYILVIKRLLEDSRVINKLTEEEIQEYKKLF